MKWCRTIVTENIEATKTHCGHRLKSSNNHHLLAYLCVRRWVGWARGQSDEATDLGGITLSKTCALLLSRWALRKSAAWSRWDLRRVISPRRRPMSLSRSSPQLSHRTCERSAKIRWRKREDWKSKTPRLCRIRTLSKYVKCGSSQPPEGCRSLSPRRSAPMNNAYFTISSSPPPPPPAPLVLSRLVRVSGNQDSISRMGGGGREREDRRECWSGWWTGGGGGESSRGAATWASAGCRIGPYEFGSTRNTLGHKSTHITLAPRHLSFGRLQSCRFRPFLFLKKKKRKGAATSVVLLASEDLLITQHN